MTKVIVQTTGQFGLLNSNGEVIHADRPTVTRHTQFVDHEVGNNQLEVLVKGLPDTACDADLQAVLKDCMDEKDKTLNVELAVEAYVSTLGEIEQAPEDNSEAEAVAAAAAQKLADQKAADQKAADEKAAADKKAADEKAAADKAAADQEAADKKAAEDKAAADKKAGK